MSDASQNILVGELQNGLFIGLNGRATLLSCPTAEPVVDAFLRSNQSAPITLDVNGCDWFDSTFAGWLLKLVARAGRNRLRLANCGSKARQSLERMHLGELFQFVELSPPARVRPLTCTTGARPTRAELELMLAAHEALAAVDDANNRLFGPIAAMLREQLGQGSRRAANRKPD